MDMERKLVIQCHGLLLCVELQKLSRGILLSFLFFLIPCSCLAQEINQLLKESVDGITVDLREPVYSNGVLSTDKGGVISGPQLRIQATNLCYTHQKTDADRIWTIQAEGELLVEFGDYVFVGKKLFYDLDKKRGRHHLG